ncbi:hypothetical protein OESDEN_23637 [Oesophagostomum dentatum]|uniref:Uncharacterized protein n=1 Tax=Oesophagostomum dentatum TaxID=61180 RepID=A0A0B1RUJ1_OESDE|nr:hypothetical protein OESDEN_23637 [Oesophagostomum dentatum]
MWLLSESDDNTLTSVEDSSSDKDLEREFRAKHWVVIILYLIILVIASVYFHKKLPEPLATDKDNSHFSELRARRFLVQLSNFGPKSAGSEACERLTKNRILAELEMIKTSASAHFMISQQNPSGCFDIDPEFTICYKNVSFPLKICTQ